MPSSRTKVKGWPYNSPAIGSHSRRAPWARGAIPLDDALPIGTQIIEALDALGVPGARAGRRARRRNGGPDALSELSAQPQPDLIGLKRFLFSFVVVISRLRGRFLRHL